MQAAVGEPFTGVIDYAGIASHEFYIDSYKYKYDVQGTLPKGITYKVSNYKIYFEGIPENTGLFTINVSLRVSFYITEYHNGRSGELEENYSLIIDVCDETVSKDYYINVK